MMWLMKFEMKFKIRFASVNQLLFSVKLDRHANKELFKSLFAGIWLAVYALHHTPLESWLKKARSPFVLEC